MKLWCFIDDGLGYNSDKGISQLKSGFVKSSLRDSGFVGNDVKSIWNVTQTTTWLGVTVNLDLGFFRVFVERESAILRYLERVTATRRGFRPGDYLSLQGF